MKPDIVSTLRDAAAQRYSQDIGYALDQDDCRMAAAEIERLRAAVQEFIRLASSQAVADEDWEDAIQSAQALVSK